jgi:MFS family permease
MTRWYDYITFNIYFLGLTTLSQTNGTVIPLLVEHFMGSEQKGTYFGIYRLWTLMVALLAQALFGMLSDRSRLRWGRRRPFIFTGTLLDVVFVAAIALTAGMAAYSIDGGQNTTGFWLMFGFAVLLQISSNFAHSAQQGVMPDLVPEEKRGRFSAVKAMLELPIPLILVALVIGPIFKNEALSFAGKIGLGMAAAMGVVLLSMGIAMFIPEKRREDTPPALDWKPFLRLLAMTAVFTTIILGTGWLSKQVQILLESIASLSGLMVTMGLVGLAAMAISIGLGVWLSVRISVGEGAVKANPSFTWWVVNRLAFLVGATNLSTFVVYYFQARLGYEKTEAASPAFILQLFVGVFILLSAIPAGWLSDRFGKKRMAMISGIIGAVGTMVALSVPSLPVIYVGGSIIGIATGLFFTANWALGTVLVPKEEAGRYLGISNLAGAGAGAVGAYIGGPIADFVSARGLEITALNGKPTEGLGYMLLFGIYGVIFLLSALALLKVKEPG